MRSWHTPDPARPTAGEASAPGRALREEGASVRDELAACFTHIRAWGWLMAAEAMLSLRACHEEEQKPSRGTRWGD
ncbi:MAG TPA: hypothetical protein VIX82_11810 [Solirubrobacteraceae bacterium]